MATKAKTVRRWVVRKSGRSGWYMMFVGPRPRRRTKQWYSDMEGFAGFLCSDDYEQFCPECLHLKPNGGPIEIRIIKVKAVKP